MTSLFSCRFLRSSRALCVLALLAATVAGAEFAPSMFGTWTRGTDDPAALREKCPWVKGAFVALTWSELEPRPGEYDWAMFDRTMGRYADAGLYIQFMVWVGPHSPRWLYDSGVPEVKTSPALDPRGRLHDWTYPYYLNAEYQRYYHRMIRAVAEHIDTMELAARRAVVCVQTAEGTTGDEGGYKGSPLNPRYALPDDRWRAFKYETWHLFEQLYSVKQPKIHLLINSGNHGQYHDWIMANMPDTWRKAGNPGHGYQLNDELKMIEFLDPVINHRNRNGEFIRCRSEMDETFKGWFQEAPVWNQYWLNLWVLHFGIDIQQNGNAVLLDERHEEGFAFTSRYAGWKDPAESPGAWCALHDGLDAADTRRFPIGEFGPGEFIGTSVGNENGIARCLRIAGAFARQGARQGDPDKAMFRVMQNRSATAMNDVGWNIWAGNYGMHLRQHDPNGTSQGHWRVGPKDQPYGRFARGFDAASGKNAMYFDLDDRFFTDGARRAGVRIVYFDQGTGSWELRYDSESSPDRVAASVRNTDTGRWKELVVELPDARLSNRCPSATDLMLVNSSEQDTIFHMIELHRR